MIQFNELCSNETVSVFGGGHCVCTDSVFDTCMPPSLCDGCWEKMYAMTKPGDLDCDGFTIKVYWMGETTWSGCKNECCENIGSHFATFGADHLEYRCF